MNILKQTLQQLKYCQNIQRSFHLLKTNIQFYFSNNQQEQLVNKIDSENNNNSAQAIISINQTKDILFKKQKKPKDRFGIHKIKDIGKLLELSRNRRLDLGLNDYVTVYLRITQLSSSPFPNSIHGLEELIHSINKEIQKSDEEDPSIGSLALCLTRSKYYQDMDLWISLCDYIIANKFDDEFDEMYNALKGFNQLQYQCSDKWQLDLVQDVLNKVISNVMGHIQMRRYSLKSLRIICDILVKNQKKDPTFYQEIEHLMMIHLSKIKDNLHSYLLEQEERDLKTGYISDFEKSEIDSLSLIEDLAAFGYSFSSIDFCSEQLFEFTKMFIQEGLKLKEKFKILEDKRDQEIAIALSQRLLQNQEKQKILQTKLQNSPQKNAKQIKSEQEDFLSFLKPQNKVFTKQQFNQKLNQFSNQKEQPDDQQEIVIPNKLIWPLQITGTGSANLLNFFDYTLSHTNSLVLEPAIQQWLTEYIYNQEAEFNLLDLNHIHKSKHLLQIENISEFSNFLEAKLFQIDFTSNNQVNQDSNYNNYNSDKIIRLEQIHDYIEVRARDEFDNDFTKLNKKIFAFLDDMCLNQMPYFSTYSVYYFTMMISDEMLFPHFLHFLAGLPIYVNKNITAYSFDEMCFFCLVCHINSHLLTESNTVSYYGSLNLLKEHIRQASLCRGFKIDMNSNFHKLLQVIDMAEFFNGGEMQ